MIRNRRGGRHRRRLTAPKEANEILILTGRDISRIHPGLGMDGWIWISASCGLAPSRPAGSKPFRVISGPPGKLAAVVDKERGEAMTTPKYHYLHY